MKKKDDDGKIDYHDVNAIVGIFLRSENKDNSIFNYWGLKIVKIIIIIRDYQERQILHSLSKLTEADDFLQFAIVVYDVIDSFYD